MNRFGTGWGRGAAGCVAGAMLLVAMGAGCRQSRGPEAHMRRGDQFFGKREFDKASIEYLNVVRAQPTNAAAMQRLGLSYFEAGNVKQAYPVLMRARKIGAESEELALKLAVIYLWAGQPAKARGEIVAMLDRHPATLNALLLLVDASRTPGELEDARKRLLAHEEQFGNQASYHIALGAIDVRSRDPKGAASAYEAAIKTDPKSAEGYMHMAGLYAMQGDTNRAETAYEKAASLAPDDSMVYLRWASFDIGRGNRKEAQEILTKAVSKSPDFQQAWFGLAEMAVQDRRLDEAMGICDKILKKSPGNPQARLMRGRIFMSQGKTDEAAKECEKILNAYPGSAEALHLLALATLQQGNMPKAISLLSQAVTANPDHAASILLLAELNLRSGHPEPVIASLPAFIEKYPRLSRPYVLLGAAYRAAQKTAEAVAVYRRMVEAFPMDPLGLHLLGTSLHEAGKEPEAAEKFVAALELQPDYVDPLAMLADQDIRLHKDLAGAIARVERQIQAAPKQAGFYDLLGRIHMSAGDPAKAEAALKKSLELHPDSGGTLVALGKIYSLTGKTQESLASLDQALAVNSNNVAAMLLSAALLQQAGRFEEARDRFERLLAFDPKSAVAANNLACLYSEHLNKPERAYTLAKLARELAPHDPYVADTLGWILCRRGDWKWAIVPLQESVDQLEDQPEILYHLAVCRAAMGDEEGARVALTKALKAQNFSQTASAKRLLAALETDPAVLDKDGLQALEALVDEPLFSIPGLARVGRAHELANRREPARVAYQKVLDRYAQHAGALLGLARLKSLDGDSAAAVDLARKARDAAPADPALGLAAGRLALRQGDSRWALGVLQETANRLPDDPEAQYALALARFHAGQVLVARNLTSVALKSVRPFESRKEAELFAAVAELWSEPGSDGEAVMRKARAALSSVGAAWLPALALQARGQALQKDAGEVETLEAIVDKAPDFAPALLRLAEVYAGRPKEEEKAYKLAVRAREMLPGDPAAASLLGRLSYRRKDVQRASQLLTEALKGAPQDAQVEFYLGLTRHQLGDKSEGRRLLEQALAVRTDFPEIAIARRVLAEPPPK